MIIQLGAVPKEDKSIIIAVKCAAAYERRMFLFFFSTPLFAPRNLVSEHYFQVIWSCGEHVAASASLFTHPCTCMKSLRAERVLYKQREINHLTV